MAWIYLPKGRKTWLLAFRANGRLQAKSTGTTDRTEAEGQLAACNALESAHRATLPLDALYHEFKKAMGQSTPDRSLRAEIAEWIAEAKSTTAPGTADRYAVIAEGLAGFLKATPDKPLLREVTTDDLREYLADVLQRKSVATANLERRCLRVFWRRAISNGRATVDPVAAVKAFRDTSEKSRRPFTVAEVRTLLTHAIGYWRFAIMTGFFTGLRISDIAGMPVGAVDLDAGFIRLATKKTGTRVTLPIPAELVGVIRERVAELGDAAKPTALLWPQFAAMPSGQRSNEFHTLLVRCGLAEARTHKAAKNGRNATRDASKISFHSLRHCFVSTLKATGAGQAVARALAGHSSDAMSDLYTSLPLETLRDAVNKLPTLTQGGG